MKPHHGPQAGRSGYPGSQNADTGIPVLPSEYVPRLQWRDAAPEEASPHLFDGEPNSVKASNHFWRRAEPVVGKAWLAPFTATHDAFRPCRIELWASSS